MTTPGEDPAAAQAKSRPRILVVDDDDLVLRACTRQLEWAGLDIWKAQSARDATDVLARVNGDLDAVLSDLNMPDGGGVELYRFIEGEYPGLQHRVIFMTGGVNSPQATDFLHKTGNPVLEKPWEMRALADLLRLVNDWAARRRARPGNNNR